ncbi:MAG: cell division protein FtsQ [Verrucomicrobiaceae bacterium]|nr:cell division protein FtsQ [Verrucomicrobiaceae bacterium]
MALFSFKKFGGKKQGASPARRAREQRRVVAHSAVAMPMKAQNKKKESKPLPWQEWLGKAMPVVAVTLVLGLLAGGWRLLHFVGSVPVSRVAVTGTLLHVDRNLLVQRVRPLLNGAGFMTVDLQAIRAEVMLLPWVADVSIQRRWPDQLVIAVTEQEAIARWGKDGLLNRRGEVFRPQPLGDVSALPVLFGPDELSADVVARYAELRELLAEQKLALASLGADERGSWSATLQGGTELRLGTGDVLKKMRSFARVYQANLSSQMERIAYIDLRYGNGVAVGWKHSELPAASNNNATNSGVNRHG